MKKLLFGLFLLTQTFVAIGQSPYHFDTKVDAGLLFFGGLAFGIGEYADRKAAPFSEVEIALLNADDINGLDKSTTENLNLNAGRFSDFLVVGSIPVGLTLLMANTSSDDDAMMLSLWGETMVTTAGLTQMTKAIAQRARPFLYNSAVDIREKTDRNGRASFFSGHTSITAANTFLCAKVFADYNPESKWRPVVWGAAAAVPALTGYLRVQAGKHFPTDVITGYLVGATIGILVPQMHKTKTPKEKGLSINAGFTGILLSYKF